MRILHRVNHVTAGTAAGGKRRTTALVTFAVADMEKVPPMAFRLIAVMGADPVSSYATADVWGDGWIPVITWEADEWYAKAHAAGTADGVIEGLKHAVARWVGGMEAGHLA